MRQQAAHHGFDRAAIIGANPSRELEQLFAQDWRFTYERFNYPDSFRFALFCDRDDRCKSGFISKRHAYSGADSHSVPQPFGNGIIELAVNGSINDDANVARFCHDRYRVNLIARDSRSTRFDAKVIRFLFKLLFCVMLALAAGFAYLAARSGDPIYTFYEWMSPARFHQYDRVILSVATEHHLDPMLVKAVVWRESRFDPRKHGSHGERGLMQVSEKAASEWARENKIASFQVDQLFDPKTNLEAGTWYLHRAFERWAAQSDPTPFALAEYNAGASRVERWSGGNGVSDIPVKQFMQKIDFPATRKYVDSIIERYQFYQRRGRM